MSIQLGILFILASHSDGRATVASINDDIRMLSGRDWSHKLREAAKRLGAPNIFAERLVDRQADGWQITERGRAFLAGLDEAPIANAPVLRLVSSRPLQRTAMPAPPQLAEAKSA